MADFWSTLTGGKVHSGSWFGLPDFGITEALVADSPRTAQGGSNLLGANAQSPSSQDLLSKYTFGNQTPVNITPLMNQQSTGGNVLGTSTTSGGGGNTNLRQQMMEGKIPWNDNLLNSGSNATGLSGEDLARQQAQAELDSALNQYDKSAEELQAQKTGLGTQRSQALSELETGYGKAQKQAESSRTEAESATQKAQNKALSTAQDVERKNRNVLRALGILSSSAAGEMLGKPYNEYQSQSADLQQGLVTKKGQIDTWLQDRLTEFNQAKTSIENQYAELVGNIDRDLRFNQKDRVQAVKAAQVAAQQAIQQAQAQAQAYQQAAQQYSSNILSQIAQIQLMQNPQADVSGILSAMIPQASKTYSPTASIYQTDEQRKKLSGLGY